MSYEQRMFKVLGLRIEGGAVQCNGRKGILHVRLDGEWKPAMFTDEAQTEPYVCECAHEALEAIRGMAREYLLVKLAHAIAGDEPPKFFTPEDFMYTYIEDLNEPKVEHTDDADSVIAKVKGSA